MSNFCLNHHVKKEKPCLSDGNVTMDLDLNEVAGFSVMSNTNHI